MMLDATQNFVAPLTDERLFAWQAALFPTGRSGMRKIVVGAWRDDATGPMQVVSGPVGKENAERDYSRFATVPVFKGNLEVGASSTSCAVGFTPRGRA